ncbi:non-ribosomal peptide synthetase [Streptomyces boluensis]|uniref:non-ribosomal peptide synthetase n=1 Tax=Streptomyces boluensis TaxID=1775135 RepID=UPI001CB6D75F|nr:AMP-binding protein [Streptomyces boluensis]
MAELTVATSTPAPLERAAGQAVTSAAQDGLWFQDALVPGAAAAHVCRAFHIDGELDVRALNAAWSAVRRRHATLRTALVDVAGRPVQQISAWDPDEPDGPDGTAAPIVLDLCTTPAPGRAEHADRLCAELAARPFAPAKAPLARLVLLRLGATAHRLLLVAHRAVADEPSVATVLAELAAGYAAERAGEPAATALTGTPASFADHARAGRAQEGTAGFRELQDWWAAQLTPVPPPLSLPVDRPRPAHPSCAGGVVPFAFGAPLAARVTRFARRTGVPAAAVLLTAFQTLLSRYGDEDRVVVAVPTDTRPDAEAVRSVGPYTELLPLVADFAEHPVFQDATAATARRMRAAEGHRGLPFAHLVGALRTDRDARRMPLGDAVFVCRDSGSDPRLRLVGTQVREYPVHHGAATADLRLTVDPAAPELTGTLEYRTELFDASSARRILDQLRTLLDAALRTPDRNVAELALDPPELLLDRVREADRLAAGTYDGPPVDELTRRWARDTPDTVAVSWRGQDVPYRELADRAEAVAAGLRRLGTVAGSPVAVRMPPGPDQYAALLGVLAAGGHLVWLGTTDSGERGRAVLADARPACLVLAGGPDGDPLAEWYRDELRGPTLDATALDATALDATVLPAAPRDRRRAPADGNGRAYLAYTSGSTGTPKGVAQTHDALAQFTTWLAGEFGIGPGMRVAQWVAPEHDPALAETFATLVSGATLCPVPENLRANPEKFTDWLAAERISHIQTVPSFARELVRVLTGRAPEAAPLALDCVLLMGEALAQELVDGLRTALPRTRLANVYGPTETIVGTWYDITGPIHGTAPIGRSIPGRQVLVLDDAGRPCPDGVSGDIVIRSPYVAQGYLSARHGDDAAFAPLPDRTIFPTDGIGCYRTGDVGLRRWDGDLEFRGRKDFQVKLYGNRLELTEIERALAAHDSVAECAVTALPGADGLASRLVTYVVPRRAPDGSALGAKEDWRSQLRSRFGRLTLPLMFVTVDGRLPRNAAGKVDRRRLPDPGARLAAGADAPRTPTEREMTELWRELLDTEDIGVQDSFFALGGHSLLLLRLIHRVVERFGVRLAPGVCFAHPTPAGLAHLVDAERPVMSAVTKETME